MTEFPDHPDVALASSLVSGLSSGQPSSDTYPTGDTHAGLARRTTRPVVPIPDRHPTRQRPEPETALSR
jgi:hypothetical protein